MKKLLLSILAFFSVVFILGSCSLIGGGKTPGKENEPPEKCKHNAEIIYETVTAATCTEIGTEAGECPLCKEKLERDIPALGHDMKPFEGKAATCAEGGFTDYEECSRCEETTYTEIPALGHDLEQFEAKLPTETDVGWNAYESCKRCDYTTYTELPATPIHNHAFGEWQTVKNASCTVAGEKIRYCIGENCGESEIGVIDALGHDEKQIPGKEPTCTEAGYEPYVSCQREGCSYKTYKKIEALGHDEQTVPGKEPTTEESGWEEYTVCKRCGEKIGYVELLPIKYNAEVLPVKGGANGIAVIIHDDGNLTTVYELEKIFYKYGLVGTLGLMSNNGKTTSNAPKWKEVLATGRWKVASHSATHTWWGTATDNGDGTYTFADNETKVDAEIVKSQQILRELFPGQRVLTFIYPGFAAEKTQYVGAYSGQIGSDVYNKIREYIYSPESRALIEDHYIGARYDSTLTGNEARVDGVRDYYYMNGGFINNSSFNNGTLSARLDAAANGGLEIFSLHYCSGDSSDEISPASMDAFCALLSEYVNQGKIWNTFYEDALLYTKEAQNSTVTISGNDSELRVTLTDTLDDEIYNYPLTVRASVPAGWEAARILQDGKTSYAAVKLLNGVTVIDADIIPDGGEAVITPISLSEVPEEEEKTPASPVGSGTVVTPPVETPDEPSIPELKVDKTVDFSEDPGVTGTGASVSDGVLNLKKDFTGSMANWTIPLCSPATVVEAFNFTFDINVASATTAFASTLLFADGNKNPYMLTLIPSGSGYYLGDCQSNSGAGTRTNFLTGSTPLSFKTWYTVKIEIVTGVSDGNFKATWYVKDSNGKFVKTGESTNFGNQSKSETATPQGTLQYFKLAVLSAAEVDMKLDNIILQGGDLPEEGNAPLIDKTYGFSTGLTGVTTSNSASSAAIEDGAIKLIKNTGYNEFSFDLGGSASEVGRIITEFKIKVAKEGATSGIVQHIHFGSKTPYIMVIDVKNGGYYLGDKTLLSGGTTQDLIKAEFDTWYSVKVEITINDFGLTASWTVTDEKGIASTASSNAFNLSSKDSPLTAPYTSVNAFMLAAPGSANVTVYLDDLSVKAYEAKAEETPEPEPEITLPADSAKKDGYISFTEASDARHYEGSAHTVESGKLYTNIPSAWSYTAFNYDGYLPNAPFDSGAKYIFEGEYTYLGGSVMPGSSGLAFIGFVHSSTVTTTTMNVLDYIKYGSDANGDGTPDSVKFFGVSFELGVTYDIKLVYTSGTANIEVYVDGTLKNTYKGNSRNVDDSIFYALGIYYRGVADGVENLGEYRCCFDNVKVSAEGVQKMPEYGEVLENGHRVDVNFFPGHVRKTVSFTIDDGNVDYDTKLLNILKPVGIKGTFNILNSNVSQQTLNTYKILYEGYEVANHHILHTTTWRDGFDYSTVTFSDEVIPNAADRDPNKIYTANTVIDGTRVPGFYYIDWSQYSPGSTGGWHPLATNETYIEYLELTTEKIEAVFGEGSVVGFAYPHGTLNEYIKNYLATSGKYLYARKTGNLKDTTGFALPSDRYAWTYNADHNCLLDVMAKFDRYADDGELKMFSFGVHAKDFETYGKWEDLKTFASLYGNRSDDFWYATNREIFEYEDAIKALVITEETITNPSESITVYIKVDGNEVQIAPGGVYTFE